MCATHVVKLRNLTRCFDHSIKKFTIYASLDDNTFYAQILHEFLKMTQIQITNLLFANSPVVLWSVLYLSKAVQLSCDELVLKPKFPQVCLCILGNQFYLQNLVHLYLLDHPRRSLRHYILLRSFFTIGPLVSHTAERSRQKYRPIGGHALRLSKKFTQSLCSSFP